MKLAIVVLTSALVGACAGTSMHANDLASAGTLTVQPASTPDHDFLVSLKNGIDIGHDADRKADRDLVALNYLRPQCPNGRVIGESEITTGVSMLGRPNRTYFLRIKC